MERMFERFSQKNFKLGVVVPVSTREEAGRFQFEASQSDTVRDPALKKIFFF